MKHQLFLLATVLLLQTTIFAQLDTFSIGNYVLPTVKYNSLDVSANLSGFSNTGDFSYNPAMNSFLKRDFTSKIGGHFRKYSNSKQSQRSLSANVKLSSSTYGQETSRNDAVRTSKEFGVSASLSSTNKFYYRKNRFFEIDAHFAVADNYRKRENNRNQLDLKWNRFTTDLSVPLLVGFGRIDDVTDSWQALQILSDFEGFGVLGKQPEQDDILGFAQKISQLKENTILQSRKKRMEDMQVLDDYLRKNGLVEEMGSTYFTSLYDSWSYGINSSRRLSGKAFSLGIIPGVNYRSEWMATDTAAIRQSQGLNLSLYAIAQYEYHKPINQKWQLDMNLKIALGPRYNFSKEYVNFDSNVSAQAGLTYYPNARTVLRTSIYSRYNSNHYGLETGWNNSLEYSMSPRVKLGLYFNTRFQSMTGNSFVPVSYSRGLHFDYGLKLKVNLF